MNLLEKSAEWVREGLITGEQRERLLQFEGHVTQSQPSPETLASSPSRRKLTATLATLGALLIGLGVILFFASNWQKISPFQKMLLLLSSLILAYGTGFFLTEKKGLPRVGSAFYFLGSILYGANIFLVAQAYNIRAHWPYGVLFWSLGVLPLAFLLSSKAMTALVVTGFSFWIGSELTLSSRYMGAVSLFQPVFLLWGVFLMGSGERLVSSKSFYRNGLVARSLGLFFVLAAEFLLTFKELLHELKPLWFFQDKLEGFNVLLVLCAAAFVVTLICLVSVIRARRAEILWTAGWIFVALLTAWGIALLPLGKYGTVALIVGILYFIQILALLYLGYFFHRADYVNLGLLAFGIFVLARYFDWAWRYMQRSLGFILGGLLLLGLGYALERSRRKLLNKGDVT